MKEKKKKKNSRIPECRALRLVVGGGQRALGLALGAFPHLGWKFTFYRRYYKTDWHLLDHVITVQCSIQRASSHE